MENKPRPSERGPKQHSENMQPLLEMLDMMEPRPETLFEKVQAWFGHLVPHAFGLIRTLVGKVIMGLAAAAIAGGILKHFSHQKPAPPAPQHVPAHTPVVHKHTAAHHPTHKKHKKHASKTKKHKTASSSQTSN